MSQAPPGVAYPWRPEASVNVKALWALPLSVLVSPAGVILGHLARHEIRRSGERGAGVALAALILGYPTIALWLVCWTSLLLATPLTD